MTDLEQFDVVVIGGGPAGATAANDLAAKGHAVMLLDKAGRIKPCGGAIPPRLIRDFDIPEDLLCAKINSARMISPSDIGVDMPIDGGYVGMVNREVFDEYLRARAAKTGAERRTGVFKGLEADGDRVLVTYHDKGNKEDVHTVAARYVIGADGARSAVASQAALPNAERVPCVFAYHEIVQAPAVANDAYQPTRCDVYYQGKLSPDFYAWVFPHGQTASIGTGSANKGFSLRSSVGELRQTIGLGEAETVRREGAPIPLKPLKKWDNGKNVIVCGDAAGVVAPSSGEGIYYAMESAREVATSVEMALVSGDARALATARKRFLKHHGKVFFILGMMQYFWYQSDKRRERFVSICQDEDVQKLTWEAYMNKELSRRDPGKHLKIFLKDTAHLFGMISPWHRKDRAQPHRSA